jgi:excisionase family DNA binding protein
MLDDAENDVLTVDDVARLLRVDTDTVREILKAGEMVHYRPRRDIRIDRSDFEDFKRRKKEEQMAKVNQPQNIPSLPARRKKLVKPVKRVVIAMPVLPVYNGSESILGRRIKPPEK